MGDVTNTFWKDFEPKSKPKRKKKIVISENDAMRKAANEFDKSFGINLKDRWGDSPSKKKKRMYKQAEKELKALIYALNGMENDAYRNTVSDDVMKMYQNNKRPKIVEASNIDWNSNINHETDSLTFRKKFATLVLCEFVGELRLITRRYVNVKYNDSKVMKHEYEILTLKSLMQTLVKFTLLMVHPNCNYKNTMCMVLMWISYKKLSVDHREYTKVFIDHIVYSRKYSTPDSFTQHSYFDEDESIEAVINTAYIICTQQYMPCKKIPKHKYFKGATLEYNLIKLVEALGKAILYRKNKSRNMSPVYRAFKLSKPVIWTQFADESKKNPAVREGVFALAFLKFVYGDDTMDKFIQEMLRKGM